MNERRRRDGVHWSGVEKEACSTCCIISTWSTSDTTFILTPFDRAKCEHLPEPLHADVGVDLVEKCCFEEAVTILGLSWGGES